MGAPSSADFAKGGYDASAAPGLTYRVLVPASGPPFELLNLNITEGAPSFADFAKGGYDAVGSAAFDLSHSRSAASALAGQLAGAPSF